MIWPVKRLGDLLLQIAAGKSFGASSAPAEEDQWGIIKVSAMTSGRFRPDENKAVPADLADPRFEIREGDLLVSRANTADYVGASVLVGPVRPRLLLSDKSLRLSPTPEVYPKWLWHILQTPPVRDQLRILATGTKDSMRNISQESLRRISIPLPTLHEQHLIVDALEDHLSRLDAAEETLKQARSRLLRLEALSFDEATRGRQIIGDTTVGDLCEVFVGTTPSRSNPGLWAGDLPWVSSGEVAFNRITDTREMIDRVAAGNPTTRIHPPGTVLIAMIGEGKTRGQVAILDIEAAHNQNCASIRIDRNKLIPEFVYYSLRSRYEQNRTTNAAGGVQPALNKSKVQQMPLPLLSLEDQREVIDEVESADLLSQRLAAALKSAQSRSSALRRSLLRAAFNGELVDQDPNG